MRYRVLMCIYRNSSVNADASDVGGLQWPLERGNACRHVGVCRFTLACFALSSFFSSK